MASQEVLVDHTVSTKEKLEALKNAGIQVPATLTAEDLQQDLPGKASELPHSNAVSYNCVTQLNPPQFSPAAIMVGLFETIPRWKLGSVINFATYSEGYPSPGDAIYAAKSLIAAAEIWNGHNVGVTFKWVPAIDDAAFVLAYGGPQGGTLARAFFPSNAQLETLYVYEYAFNKTPQPATKRGTFNNYDILTKVFLHELGHVLGLRHEFAMKPGPSGRVEGGAILIGTANEDSIMSYQFPPEIQDSDIKDTRAFYQHPLIVDFTPDN